VTTDSVSEQPSVDSTTQVNANANCQLTPSQGKKASALNVTVSSNDGTTNDGFLNSTPAQACSLIVAAGSRITIGVDGFLPESVVFAYLLPTPTSLGRVTTPKSGRVEISALIPADTALGNHILQLSGYLSATEPTIVTVGLTVKSSGNTKMVALKLAYGKSGIRPNTAQRAEIRQYVDSHNLSTVRLLYSTKGAQKSYENSLKQAMALASYIKTLPGVGLVTLRGSKKIKESVVFTK